MVSAVSRGGRMYHKGGRMVNFCMKENTKWNKCAKMSVPLFKFYSIPLFHTIACFFTAVLYLPATTFCN